MKSRPTIKLLSALVQITACLATVAIILFRQDWFGKGDVYALLFWTIPLAAALAVAGDNFAILKTDKIIPRILFHILVSGLLAFGWIYVVYLILGPWINTFSFPVIYIWTIGNFFQLFFLDIFLRKNERKPRLILGLMVFPLTLAGSIIIMYTLSAVQSYVTRPQPETYLIPEKFEGKFRIVYGEACGLEPGIENGRRILEIPDNGILIIKPEFESGIIDHEYYLVDRHGGRRKLNERSDNDQTENKTAGVLLGGSGGFGGPMPDGSSSTESPLAIHFTDFTVFNKDTATIDNRTRYQLDQRFDSLTTSAVEACRKKNGR